MQYSYILLIRMIESSSVIQLVRATTTWNYLWRLVNPTHLQTGSMLSLADLIYLQIGSILSLADPIYLQTGSWLWLVGEFGPVPDITFSRGRLISRNLEVRSEICLVNLR